jgi:hypothetical protein
MIAAEKNQIGFTVRLWWSKKPDPELGIFGCDSGKAQWTEVIALKPELHVLV